MNTTHTLRYSHGCINDSLTIDGHETADMTQEQLAQHLITLLRSHCYPADIYDFQRIIQEIAESNSILTSPFIHCDQCGDVTYTYTLKF